jgi:hypothetical protein
MLTFMGLQIETTSLPRDKPVFRGVFVSDTNQHYAVELGRRSAKRIQHMLAQEQHRAEQLATEAAKRQ